MNKLIACSSLSLLAYSMMSIASPMPANSSAFPAYNLNFDTYTNGLNNVYVGAGNPFAHKNTVRESDLGYSKHFTNSNNLWGVKFLSNYLGLSARNKFDNLQSSKSIQANIDHELGLLAYIGRSFSNGHVYLGGGPSLLGSSSNSANSYSTQENLSHFSTARWFVGGAAQLGMSYYFDPTWYLDLNYTYAITGKNPMNATFAMGYTPVNSTDLNGADRLSAQSLALSIKKLFTL